MTTDKCWNEKEIESLKQFTRRHKYPTQKELVGLLEEAMARHENGPFYGHFLQVYSEFGFFQYECSKIIYENIYNSQTVQDMGESIYRKNGLAGLQAVFYMMCWFSPFKEATDEEIKNAPKQIQYMWDGVGNWRC